MCLFWGVKILKQNRGDLDGNLYLVAHKLDLIGLRNFNWFEFFFPQATFCVTWQQF